MRAEIPSTKETNLAWGEGVRGRLPRRTVSTWRPLKWLAESLARRSKEEFSRKITQHGQMSTEHGQMSTEKIGHNPPEKLDGWKGPGMLPSGAGEEGR